MVSKLLIVTLIALCGLVIAGEIYDENGAKPIFSAYLLRPGSSPYQRRSALPDLKVWTDGTIVYQNITAGRYGVTTKRVMWNRVNTNDVAVVRKAFLNYNFKGLTNSSPNDEGICMQFWDTGVTRPTTVCTCEHCNNPTFTTLRNTLLNLIGKATSRPNEFIPQAGWFVSEIRQCGLAICPTAASWTTAAPPASTTSTLVLKGQYLTDAWSAMIQGLPVKRTDRSNTVNYDWITVQVAGLSVVSPPSNNNPTPSPVPTPVPSGSTDGGNGGGYTPTPYSYRNPNPGAWLWILLGLGIFFLITLCGIIARAMARRRQQAAMGDAYEIHSDDANDEFPGTSSSYDNGGNAVQMQSWSSSSSMASAPTATNVPSYAQTAQMPVYMGTNQYGQPVMYTVVPASYTMTQAPVYVQPQDAMATYTYYVPTATNQ